MPSRPMFTMPTRSEKMPPRPAIPIGTARPSATAIVPEEVMSLAPLTMRTTDMTISPSPM